MLSQTSDLTPATAPRRQSRAISSDENNCDGRPWTFPFSGQRRQGCTLSPPFGPAVCSSSDCACHRSLSHSLSTLSLSLSHTHTLSLSLTTHTHTLSLSLSYYTHSLYSPAPEFPTTRRIPRSEKEAQRIHQR